MLYAWSDGYRLIGSITIRFDGNLGLNKLPSHVQHAVAYLLCDTGDPLNQHDQSWVFSSVIHIYMIEVWLAQVRIKYL